MLKARNPTHCGRSRPMRRPAALAPNPPFVGRTFRFGSNLTQSTPIVLSELPQACSLHETFRYAVDLIESISQIRARSPAAGGAQIIPGVTKMQLGNRDELSVQIRDYDTCFEESDNGQKLLQGFCCARRSAFLR